MKQLKQRKWQLGILGIIAFLLCGATITWRSASINQSSDPDSENVGTEPARLAVRTAAVKQEPIQAWISGDGTVRAIVKKHLSFQSEGTIDYIKKINGRDLREGDRVREGELLARLDRRKQDADITVATVEQTEAENQVASARANLRKAEESLAQANADLEKAKTDEAFARVDWKRYQELAAQGGIAQREVDVKETDHRKAQAGTEAAQAAVRAAQADVFAAQTDVKTAQAKVNSAKAKLTQSYVQREDTELTAPFDGIISRLNIREGEYWTPQFVNASGDYQSILERLPMIVIVPNQFEVTIELPSFQGAQVEPGQRALIVLDRDRAQGNSQQLTGQDLIELASVRGSVVSVSSSVEPGSRTIRVILRIRQGAENLKDGQQVSAWIATQEKANATVAPFNAFVSRDRQLFVFVVDETEGTVEQRAVQEGIEGLAKREILEGVKIGEKLVTDGKTQLVNGAPIKIIP